MFVMCVIKHLFIRTVLKDIKLYIVVCTLVFEMFVIMHTVISAV